MQQLRLLGLLLQPSLLSLASSLVAVCAFLFIINAPYLLAAALLPPDSVLLEPVLQSMISDAQNSAVSALDHLVVLNAVILLVALGCGMAVFIVLEIITRSAGEMQQSFQTIRFVKGIAAKLRLGREIGLRWFVRIAAITCWAAYWIFWFTFLVPFCIALIRIGAVELPSMEGIGYFGAGTILLVLGFHMHIVFMRLVVLRSRLFGGQDAITEVMLDNESKS